MMHERESQLLSFTLEIPPGLYNQVGLTFYELPNMVFAWVVLLLSPRSVAASASVPSPNRRPAALPIEGLADST